MTITRDGKYLFYDNPGAGDCGVYAFVIGIMGKLRLECACVSSSAVPEELATSIRDNALDCPLLNSMLNILGVHGFNLSRGSGELCCNISEFIKLIREFCYQDISGAHNYENKTARFLQFANIIFRQILYAGYLAPITTVLETGIQNLNFEQLNANSIVVDVMSVLRGPEYLGTAADQVALDLARNNDIYRYEPSRETLRQLSMDIKKSANVADGACQLVGPEESLSRELVHRLAQVILGYDYHVAINTVRELNKIILLKPQLTDMLGKQQRPMEIAVQSGNGAVIAVNARLLQAIEQEVNALNQAERLSRKAINKAITVYNVERYLANRENELNMGRSILKLLCQAPNSVADAGFPVAVHKNSLMTAFLKDKAGSGNWLTEQNMVCLAKQLNVDPQLICNGTPLNTGRANNAVTFVNLHNSDNIHWTTFIPICGGRSAAECPEVIRQYVNYAETPDLSVLEIRKVLEGYLDSVSWPSSWWQPHRSLVKAAIIKCNDEGVGKIQAVPTVMQFIFGQMPPAGRYDPKSEFAMRLTYLCFRHKCRDIEEARGSHLTIDDIKEEFRQYRGAWWNFRWLFRHHRSIANQIIAKCDEVTNSGGEVRDVMKFVLDQMPGVRQTNNYNRNGEFATTAARLLRRFYRNDNIVSVQRSEFLQGPFTTATIRNALSAFTEESEPLAAVIRRLCTQAEGGGSSDPRRHDLTTDELAALMNNIVNAYKDSDRPDDRNRIQEESCRDCILRIFFWYYHTDDLVRIQQIITAQQRPAAVEQAVDISQQLAGQLPLTNAAGVVGTASQEQAKSIVQLGVVANPLPKLVGNEVSASVVDDSSMQSVSSEEVHQNDYQ